MNNFFSLIDYLIFPSSSTKPKKLEEITTVFSPSFNVVDSLLIMANFGGYPSITIPFTYVDDMPIGINITGRIFQDGYVLSLASKIEEITSLHDLVKEVV